MLNSGINWLREELLRGMRIVLCCKPKEWGELEPRILHYSNKLENVIGCNKNNSAIVATVKSSDDATYGGQKRILCVILLLYLECVVGYAVYSAFW
ncbi:unnamed protein product [Colias eurytheme]|nr:unnamed protein product [Colias eurytheme]